MPWIKEPLFAEGGYVKADFEVFVPAYYPLDQRWMLAQFADYAGGEQMHVYLLSAKSVARGKERGMKEQEMVSVLERLSLTPLPQNVTERILQWGHRHQNIFFREVVVMEGEADAEWVAHSVVEKHAEKIGPTRFLVEKNKVEKLATALQNKGYKVSWLDKEEDPIWKRPYLLTRNELATKQVCTGSSR